MPNDYRKRDNATLIVNAQTLADKAGTAPASFGLTAAQITGVTADRADLVDALDELAIARNAVALAQAKKDFTRDNLINGLAAAAKIATANPSISDLRLVEAGFAPRPSRTGRPASLAAPTKLVATASVDGTVRLSWSRNGNGYPTTFVVETSQGAEWTVASVTLREALDVAGAAPGVPAYYRVTASRAGISSLPSATASVYAPSEAPPTRLRVA